MECPHSRISLLCGIVGLNGHLGNLVELQESDVVLSIHWTLTIYDRSLASDMRSYDAVPLPRPGVRSQKPLDTILCRRPDSQRSYPRRLCMNQRVVRTCAGCAYCVCYWRNIGAATYVHNHQERPILVRFAYADTFVGQNMSRHHWQSGNPTRLGRFSIQETLEFLNMEP